MEIGLKLRGLLVLHDIPPNFIQVGLVFEADEHGGRRLVDGRTYRHVKPIMRLICIILSK